MHKYYFQVLPIPSEGNIDRDIASIHFESCKDAIAVGLALVHYSHKKARIITVDKNGSRFIEEYGE